MSADERYGLGCLAVAIALLAVVVVAGFLFWPRAPSYPDWCDDELRSDPWSDPW